MAADGAAAASGSVYTPLKHCAVASGRSALVASLRGGVAGAASCARSCSSSAASSASPSSSRPVWLPLLPGRTEHCWRRPPTCHKRAPARPRCWCHAPRLCYAYFVAHLKHIWPKGIRMDSHPRSSTAAPTSPRVIRESGQCSLRFDCPIRVCASSVGFAGQVAARASTVGHTRVTTGPVAAC